MWRSLLSYDEWHGLYETIALKTILGWERREIRLWRSDATFIPTRYKYVLEAQYTSGPSGPETKIHGPVPISRLWHSQRKLNFSCNMSEDTKN